jgi:fumarate hydratase, class II
MRRGGARRQPRLGSGNGMTEVEVREEYDTLGAVSVPAHRLWGAQTERSRLNFAAGQVAGFRWPRHVIRAFGLIKHAAAGANEACGALSAPLAELIARAAQEVADGSWDDEFPLGVFQTGSGTHSNMNANEVIANRANELDGASYGTYLPIHPNDHVNRGQSSNDVFPTVMHLATLDAFDRLAPAVHRLRVSLVRQARRWWDIPMLGRTHLQDATPIMAGEVVSGWIAHLDDAWTKVLAARTELCAVALGATAVGTGVGTKPDFAPRAIERLAATSGQPLVQARSLVAALTAHDAMVAASAAQRALAAALLILANDLRLYASGPRGGFAEVQLPANEPGSSIMPGKVNPTQCEALSLVALHTFGADAVVAWANTQGSLQLNVYKPLMLHHVLQPAELLRVACLSFAEHCVDGLTLDHDRIRAHLDDSLMLVTALVPHLSYGKAAAIAVSAHAARSTLKEAAVKTGWITGPQFDAWVDPQRMARPHGRRPDPPADAEE